MKVAHGGSSGLVPCVCTDLVFGGWDTLEAIDAVAKAGVPAIEFWGWRDKAIDAIGERARRHGLQIAAMSLDPAVRILDGNADAEFLKSVEESLAVAKRIGCRRLVVHVQPVPMGSGISSPTNSMAAGKAKPARRERASSSMAIAARRTRSRPVAMAAPSRWMPLG